MSMELKNQVCAQEQSHRLYELGVRAESIFYYRLRNVPREFWNLEMPGSVPHSWQAPQDEYHAYNVAELGEMLPTLGIKRCKSNNGRGKDYYWLEYKSQDWSDENEAKLLAKFLIYLLENKLVDVATINNKS